MELLGEVWRKLRFLFRRRQFDRDLEQEMQFHLDMKARAKREMGLADSEAQYAARRQVGNTTLLRERSREMWGWGWLERLGQDLRYGIRVLRHSPTFTAVAVISLALGIGANTALFSLINAMLLRALPVKDPQQLVEFARHHPDGAIMTNMPPAVFSYLRSNTGVADVFALCSADMVLHAKAGPEKIDAQFVSGSFFSILGVKALTGRTISPDDDQPGASRVAVLSYPFWSRRFGLDPAILGTNVQVGGEPATVIGVMPRSFVGVDRSRIPDMWLAFAGSAPAYQPWVVARLKRGMTIPQAQTALQPLFHQALESLGDEFKASPEHERQAFMAQRLLIHSAANGTAGLRWSYWDYSITLKVLLGLTSLVLVITCANLAHLLMARSGARSREIAIRLAVGAGRGQLVRQLLTETALLSAAGGALGLLAAVWGQRVLVAFLMHDPENTALEFHLDGGVLGFSVALSFMTTLLCGLLPAIRATSMDLAGSIHAETRCRAATRMPLARVLLATQVALSMVLLVGAGLFARSLRNLGAAELGLERENLLLMDVRSPGKTTKDWQQFWLRLDEGVSRLPGIRGVALAGDAVFGRGGWNQTVWLLRPGQPPQNAKVNMNPVGPGFFATVGISVVIGREFSAHDGENTPLVAVVNQTFARRFFGSENPIGKRFGDRGAASANRYEIVGVVGDAKYGSVRERVRPMVFYPLIQATPRNSRVLHVRTARRPAALVSSIRQQILAANPDALITNVSTLPGVIRDQLRQDRMFTTLASFFALLALALGAIGIYGVLAYRVTRRTAEIGVRMALGAERSHVLWLIMRETLMVVAAGVGMGIPAALATSRLIRSLLFELEPSDPLTIGCALVTLFAAAGLAGFLPARRAASVQPIVALRNE